MKIDLPAALTAEVEPVYPEPMNWADRSIHPTHWVVIRFGDVEVTRRQLLPEQERQIDYHDQYNQEVMAGLANEVVADLLRKVFESVS